MHAGQLACQDVFIMRIDFLNFVFGIYMCHHKLQQERSPVPAFCVK